MSSYVEDMDVDAKIAGRWFPVKVQKVFEVGHVVQVNHPDWPPECAVYIDPITNNLARAGSKAAQYFDYDQVDTFTSLPAKPPHPDAALYHWPGVKEDDTDASLFLGSLTCRVSSDRVYGMREWYDTLVATEDDDESLQRWKLVELWLKKQSKLIEVEEKVVEVMEFGRPTPSLHSKAGKRVQERLHENYSWRLVESWLRLGYDLREIKRSHHKDEDDDWKRSEQINELVENRGVAKRGLPDGAMELLGDIHVSDSDADASDGGDSEGLGNTAGDDDELDLSAFQTAMAMARNPKQAGAKGGKGGGKAAAAKLGKAEKAEVAATEAVANAAAKSRPLHTYTITLNLFINIAAQKSSPVSTALSLCAINSLMAALFPVSAYPQLHAMVAEAEAAVPPSLESSVNLEHLMSLSVRDEQGKPFFYDTLKKREAEKQAKAEADAAEKKRQEEEAAEASKAKKGRGGRMTAAAKKKAELKEQKEREEKEAQEKEEKEAEEDNDDSMDLGMGEREEELSAACGLNITLRDYQTHTVQLDAGPGGRWRLHEYVPLVHTPRLTLPHTLVCPLRPYLHHSLPSAHLPCCVPLCRCCRVAGRRYASLPSRSSSRGGGSRRRCPCRPRSLSIRPTVPIRADAEAPLFYFSPSPSTLPLQTAAARPRRLERGGDGARSVASHNLSIRLSISPSPSPFGSAH